MKSYNSFFRLRGIDKPGVADIMIGRTVKVPIPSSLAGSAPATVVIGVDPECPER
jgi:hypothetical protein